MLCPNQRSLQLRRSSSSSDIRSGGKEKIFSPHTAPNRQETLYEYTYRRNLVIFLGAMSHFICFRYNSGLWLPKFLLTYVIRAAARNENLNLACEASYIAIERIFSGGRDTIAIRHANFQGKTIRNIIILENHLKQNCWIDPPGVQRD